MIWNCIWGGKKSSSRSFLDIWYNVFGTWFSLVMQHLFCLYIFVLYCALFEKKKKNESICDSRNRDEDMLT